MKYCLGVWKEYASVVHIIGTKTAMMLPEVRDTRIKYYATIEHRGHPILRLLTSLYSGIRIREPIDIVCSYSHFVFDVLPATLISLIKHNCALVVYVHHLHPPPMVRRKYHPLLPSLLAWVSDRLSLLLVKRFARVVVAPPPTQEDLVKYGIKKERLVEHYAIPTLVDFDLIDKIDSAEKEFDGCFLGRITPLKGIFDLPKIWEEVRKHKQDAILIIIGIEDKGPAAKLRRILKRKRLDRNVFMLGFVDETTKYRILRKSKVFVFPSYEEGWGATVVEALSCGTPAVAYDLRPYKIYAGEGMIRVPVGNTKQFAAEVIKLLNDPSLRQIKSKATLKIRNLMNWKESVAKQVLSILARAQHNC